MKSKFSYALTLAVIAAMLVTAVALADTITADADVITGIQTSVNLGTVAPGAVLTPGVHFLLQCAGNKHVDAGQVLSISFNSGSSTFPSGGGLSATNTSIGGIPPEWPDDATGPANCPSSPTSLSDNGASTVTITAPMAPGPYTYVAKYSLGFSPSQSDDPNDITGPSPVATFTLTVSAPVNTPPTVSLTGVTDGASYPKGSVPAAGCSVTDAEDGNPTFAATLSAISGPDGANGIGSQTASCSYTDGGGLTASASATYSIVDGTAPTIGYVLTPSLPDGDNGWYKSDVSLVWTVTENDSTSSLVKTGCDNQIIIADQPATDYSCSATSDGGSAGPVTVSIKRDGTAPIITYVDRTPANGNGWNNEDVTVDWSCSDDGGSGVVSVGASQTVSTEGENQEATGRCTDNAGNTASDTQSGINIDKGAPTASASASPDANANGWNNSAVTVSFSGTDGLSGIDFCDTAVVLNSEGVGQSASGTCTDKAGNVSAPAGVSGINVDKTAPTASASASPAANANGWNNTNVTVSFSGSDALSGIDSCSANVVLSSEGANQSASGTCTDLAGNVSDPASASVSIDKTNPSVSLVGGPADGGTYYFGFVPAAPTCSASDALSGLYGACSVSGYSALVGGHTVTASATDKAGNSASASATYTVLAWTLKGFYQPVDMNGVFNLVKGGSTVPFKFEIFAGSTEITDVAAIQGFTTTKVACDTSAVFDDIETTATGGTSLRYDMTAGQFVYNWQTLKGAGVCYRFTMTTQDGSSLIAFFKTK